MHILADFARAVSEAREAKHWSQEMCIRDRVKEVGCGDIGAVSKLTDTSTGDTLCAPGVGITLKGIESVSYTHLDVYKRQGLYRGLLCERSR